MQQYNYPDENGHFGEFGGCFIAETLMEPLHELQQAYQACRDDDAFMQNLLRDLQDYVGRPTPLYYAERLTKEIGGAKIYLKREDLNHTGAHKINNTMGQLLLAQRLGKKRIVAETGAGQHGVATATVAARLGLQCVVYMGAEDVERQAPNVQRMKLLGAEVVPVQSGSKTLKDAVNEALRDWVANVDDTFYCLGSVAGPHPYPMMVRDFQRIIGMEAREQILEKEGRLPDAVVACVGGGSNAIGLFHPFIDDKDVRIIGVEAAGEGIETGKHAAAIAGNKIGVFQGARSYVMSDDDGQIILPHSISAGLDYPAIGPEHAYLASIGRADYVSVTDKRALEGFHQIARTEGIIAALESSHAIAYLNTLAKEMDPEQIIVVNLSGRGDKDLESVIRIQNAGSSDE
tara:strand:+ start:121094 stop:122302 length:1209 start_codon:yes stop_codon:yes gene_type:complete